MSIQVEEKYGVGKEVWNTVENSGVWENKTCLLFAVCLI